MPFERETRTKIINRDQGGAVGSASYDFPDLQASHINHSKFEEESTDEEYGLGYNSIQNGNTRNRPQHSMEHAFEADKGGDMIHKNFKEYTEEITARYLTPDEIAYLQWLDFMQGNNDNI